MEKSNITTIGSVVSAIVASLCCIGPVVAVLLGIGSIGVFTAFEAYRPYFIGATAVLLGLAFYLSYRKREVKCEDGTCKFESASKWNKLSVWLATFFAAIAIAFPYLGITLHASTNENATPQATVVLNIEGMDCKACAFGIEGALSRIAGVHRATVQYEKGNAIVEYDPVVVQPRTLIEHVEEIGFKAKPAETKSETSQRK
jgi:mercuric ion transport protein